MSIDLNERFGWTLDDLHERIEACDRVIEAARTGEGEWIEAASLTFMRLCDEVVSRLKSSELAVPFAVLRRMKRLDERLDERQVESTTERLRAWLRRAESDMPAAPSPHGALRLIDHANEGGEVKALVPRRPSEPKAPERLKPVDVERWVALPQRAVVRERAAEARKALADFALHLHAANEDEGSPFAPLDRTRLSLTLRAASHMLNGPLVEKGLLRAAMRNAGIVQRASDEPLRRTAGRTRECVELLLDDLP